jgi:hypothetical protein
VSGVRPGFMLCAALLAACAPWGAAVRDACAQAGEVRPAPGVGRGYRLYEATAASVNGEVLFLSDLARRACLLECGAFPGDEPERLPLWEVRDRLIRETLVLQEEEKLGLGGVDDAALDAAAAAARIRMESCASPCAEEIGADEVRSYVEKRLLAREFLRKRFAVFVEVTDEEVQREIQRRISRERAPPESLPEEAVRRDIRDEKTAREIRNWLDRVTSKSRIVLSPLEEK